MKRLAVLGLLAACTAPNPSYVGFIPTDGGSGPDGSAIADLATPTDLTGSDLSPVCIDGQRICLAQSGSGVCMGGQFTLDRKCPADSICQKGFCRAPTSGSMPPLGSPCDTGGAQENQCFASVTDQLSCQPFVNPSSKAVSWACEKPVGAGVPGTACTEGAQCRSGFCGDNGTCFRACHVDTDCPQTNGQLLHCADVKITVEGVAVTTGSCVP
jgi:hypothetical protein